MPEPDRPNTEPRLLRPPPGPRRVRRPDLPGYEFTDAEQVADAIKPPELETTNTFWTPGAMQPGFTPVVDHLAAQQEEAAAQPAPPKPTDADTAAAAGITEQEAKQLVKGAVVEESSSSSMLPAPSGTLPWPTEPDQVPQTPTPDAPPTPPVDSPHIEPQAPATQADGWDPGESTGFYRSATGQEWQWFGPDGGPAALEQQQGPLTWDQIIQELGPPPDFNQDPAGWSAWWREAYDRILGAQQPPAADPTDPTMPNDPTQDPADPTAPDPTDPFAGGFSLEGLRYLMRQIVGLEENPHGYDIYDAVRYMQEAHAAGIDTSGWGDVTGAPQPPAGDGSGAPEPPESEPSGGEPPVQDPDEPQPPDDPAPPDDPDDPDYPGDPDPPPAPTDPAPENYWFMGPEAGWMDLNTGVIYSPEDAAAAGLQGWDQIEEQTLEDGSIQKWHLVIDPSSGVVRWAGDTPVGPDGRDRAGAFLTYGELEQFGLRRGLDGSWYFADVATIQAGHQVPFNSFQMPQFWETTASIPGLQELLAEAGATPETLPPPGDYNPQQAVYRLENGSSVYWGVSNDLDAWLIETGLWRPWVSSSGDQYNGRDEIRQLRELGQTFQLQHQMAAQMRIALYSGYQGAAHLETNLSRAQLILDQAFLTISPNGGLELDHGRYIEVYGAIAGAEQYAIANQAMRDTHFQTMSSRIASWNWAMAPEDLQAAGQIAAQLYGGGYEVQTDRFGVERIVPLNPSQPGWLNTDFASSLAPAGEPIPAGTSFKVDKDRMADLSEWQADIWHNADGSTVSHEVLVARMMSGFYDPRTGRPIVNTDTGNPIGYDLAQDHAWLTDGHRSSLDDDGHHNHHQWIEPWAGLITPLEFGGGGDLSLTDFYGPQVDWPTGRDSYFGVIRVEGADTFGNFLDEFVQEIGQGLVGALGQIDWSANSFGGAGQYGRELEDEFVWQEIDFSLGA